MATEWFDGYSFEKQQDGQTGQRVFRGTTSTNVPAIGSAHSDSDASAQCKCRSVAKTLIGLDASGAKIWQWTCSYDTRTNNDQNDLDPDSSDRRFRMEFGVTGDLIPKNSGLYWKSDSEDIEQAVPLFKPTIEVVVGKCVSTFPSGYAAYVGKVNSSVFNGYAAGTVMFTGASTEESKDDEGSTVWMVEERFSITPEGWSKLLRADTGAYDTVMRPGALDLYSATDFTGLG